MTKTLTAIIERDGDGYVAVCPERDIAGQGASIIETAPSGPIQRSRLDTLSDR